MVKDHTGEVIGNRLITGPGALRTSTHLHDGKMRLRREQWWCWQCVDCGETGESSFGILNRYCHHCKPKEDPERDAGKLCGPQCVDCGHFRSLGSSTGMGCHYLLDTGHMRPKVHLLNEPCPGRDTEFEAPKAKPIGLIIPREETL